MKFGTLQGVIEEPLSSVFSVAAKLGFEGVELDWSDYAQAQPGGPLGPENRQKIRQTAAQASVEIPSVAAHFLNQGGLADADKEAFRPRGCARRHPPLHRSRRRLPAGAILRPGNDS